MPKLPSWSDFWKILSKARQPRPRQASIYRSLPLGMTVVVAVTVLIGGFSAIVLTWWQLEQQVQLRVLGAQSSTQALYMAEQRNILQLVQLVSERPTLCALLQRRDIPELTSYLETLRQNTSADSLVAVTPDGQMIISGSAELIAEPFPDRPQQLPFADFIVLGNPSRLAIFAVSEVASADLCERGLAGRVIAIQVLDRDFMLTLAKNTGLEQSLIIGDRRVATSLANVTNWPLNPDAALQVMRTQEACCTVGASGDETYYVGLAPLLDNQGQVVALSEVALYANTIRNGALKTIALILGISVLAGLAGGALTFPLSRRITDPLYRLSNAAERMGSGDLETPIPISSGWITIDRLASQLDRARRNLRQTQRIIRQELRRIVHTLGAIQEGVITINMDGIVTWANADACHILGYDIFDLLRKHYLQIFRPAPGEITTLSDVLWPSLGQPVPTHLGVINAQGSSITLSVSHSLLDTEDEDTKGTHFEHILILRDVSEDQAVDRLRSEFLANIAHEFRTPLSAISASTELLVEEGGDMTSNELSDLAHTIRLSAVHLQSLVDNLLESAIIEAGVFRLRYRSVKLQEVLCNVDGMMSPLLQRRQQRLEVNAPEDLPDFWADPDRLNQALVNLVENASKFSPTAAIVALSVKHETDTITFEVLDSGPGLPTERFVDLFNRFVTGDRPRGAQYGIGLGLPIVKAIAEAHGGRVGAENRPMGGARVWLTIPYRQQGKEGEGI
jgi:signal transduction histidine kinase